MGNRRHHKKLRAEVRARMARTGEGYQTALERVRASGPARPAGAGALDGPIDLIPFDYFGVPSTLAILGGPVVVVFGHAPGGPGAHRAPPPSIRFLNAWGIH